MNRIEDSLSLVKREIEKYDGHSIPGQAFGDGGAEYTASARDYGNPRFILAHGPCLLAPEYVCPSERPAHPDALPQSPI